MKKKAIERIPYLTVKKCRRKQVKFLAAVEKIQVEGEEHLFLEIYKNETGSLKIPEYRFVYRKSEWGYYQPKNKNWLQGSILDDCNNQIWNRYRSTEEKKSETHIDGEDIEKIKKFTESETQRTYWWSYIKDLENDIKQVRLNKREERRQSLLKERCEGIGELPKGFEEWYKNELFKDENYLYYKRKGRYATFWCSKCGESYKYATSTDDTFEGQFEPVIQVPRDGTRAKCEKCGAVGRYKAAGRAKQKIFGLRKACYIGQRYKESGIVMRYIEIEKYIEIGRPERYDMVELARSFFEEKKKKITDYYLYDTWKGKSDWFNRNVGTFGSNIKEREAAVYPETYEALKETAFRYSGLKELNEQYSMIRASAYLSVYNDFPQIEMLVKMKMYRLVEKLIDFPLEYYIKNKDAGKPHEALGIYSDRLNLLIEHAGEPSLLKMLQTEKALNERWTEEQMNFLEIVQLGQNRLKIILRLMTMQKYMNRVKKYAGVSDEIDAKMCGHMQGRITNVSSRYVDYLEMRTNRGYDMTNTVYLYPRDLDEAHHQMVMEINKDELDKRIEEVEEKYKDIRRNYLKWRKQYFYEDDRYIIRPAKSAEEIVMEGRELHHCVGGDTYLSSHNRGESVILMLRFKDKPKIPYITIEISETEIKQWYGENDSKPDKEGIQEWLDDYLKILKEKNPMTRLRMPAAG